MSGVCRIARAAFFRGCVALALAGCSSNEEHNAALKSILNPVFPEPTADFIALAEREAPALVLSIEAREGAFSTLLQQTVNDKGEETWISGDSLSIGMKQGMIIATRGFGGDILAADASETQRAILNGTTGTVTRFMTALNGNNEAQTFAFVCRITHGTRQPVDLGAYVAATMLVQEDCRNETDSFQNLYWVTQGSRQIVQSRQWISPHLGTLAMRIAPR